MKSLLRRTTTVSVAVSVLLALGPAAAAMSSLVPHPPTGVELVAGRDFSITISWIASPGASSYNIYRGTSPGGEGNTPIATTTSTTYKDTHLSSEPVYFYQLTAVNSSGESARTREDASKTPPPPSTGGNIPGLRQGNSLVFYGKDARLSGFDWFEAFQAWFPEALSSLGSISPGQSVIDMAYSSKGTMAFNNVQVKTAGLYTIDWRYAFASGVFRGVTNRQMGLSINGKVITNTERFPIAGDFNYYEHSYLQVSLHAGINSITLFAVSDHGVARVDQMTVTAATASVPSAPTNLTASAGNTTVSLSWTSSPTGSPISYEIYRGTMSDGEAITPIANTNGTTTSFTDTGLNNGTAYYYVVAAINAQGISPDSNEVSVAPA
jgi:hypothetical protein